MAYDRFFAVLLDPSLEIGDVDLKLRTSAADALAYLAGDKALEVDLEKWVRLKGPEALLVLIKCDSERIQTTTLRAVVKLASDGRMNLRDSTDFYPLVVASLMSKYSASANLGVRLLAAMTGPNTAVVLVKLDVLSLLRQLYFSSVSFRASSVGPTLAWIAATLADCEYFSSHISIDRVHRPVITLAHSGRADRMRCAAVALHALARNNSNIPLLCDDDTVAALGVLLRGTGGGDTTELVLDTLAAIAQCPEGVVAVAHDRLVVDELGRLTGMQADSQTQMRAAALLADISDVVLAVSGADALAALRRADSSVKPPPGFMRPPALVLAAPRIDYLGTLKRTYTGSSDNLSVTSAEASPVPAPPVGIVTDSPSLYQGLHRMYDAMFRTGSGLPHQGSLRGRPFTSAESESVLDDTPCELLAVPGDTLLERCRDEHEKGTDTSVGTDDDILGRDAELSAEGERSKHVSTTPPLSAKVLAASAKMRSAQLAARILEAELDALLPASVAAHTVTPSDVFGSAESDHSRASASLVLS